jgi:hypothetical protein
MTGSLTFKQADSAWEFEQIHRLNYRTFAEEIGQYAPDGSGVLVDRFHDKNRYFIAVQDDEVIGMVAVHDQAPFSVSSRLSDPAILDSLGDRLLEVRLLALDAGSRHRMIFANLLWQVYLFAHQEGHSHLIISGITAKLEMYERMGFEALGPAVQTGEASFVPMALCLQPPPERLLRDTQLYLARQNRMRNMPLLSLMPGPVEIAEPVREAFCRRPISHRCPEFLEAYDRTCSRLRSLVGGMDVAPLVGSGTTGNDALSLHLAAAVGDQKGLVLTNGEFGERLIGQARRAGLNFVPLQWSWGDPWDLNRIEDNPRRRSALDLGRSSRNQHRRSQRPHRPHSPGPPLRREGRHGLREQHRRGSDRFRRPLYGDWRQRQGPWRICRAGFCVRSARSAERSRSRHSFVARCRWRNSLQRPPIHRAGAAMVGA